MADTPTPQSPKRSTTEAERFERLKQQRAKIDQQLHAIAGKMAADKRRAETKSKIIVGSLAKEAGLVADLAAKASERDREHLRATGWIS